MDEPRHINLFDADNLEAAGELMGLNRQFRAARVLLTAHQLWIFTALMVLGPRHRRNMSQNQLWSTGRPCPI